MKQYLLPLVALSLVGLDAAAQQPGPTPQSEFQAVLVDVEMHTRNQFSPEQDRNLFHVINQEFLKKNNDVVVSINTQQMADLRLDVFLSEGSGKSTGTTKDYAVFVIAFNKAKLRKRLGGANLSEEQISQWIDDRRFPVLEFDYVYWTICPANELNSTLASWAREINDRLLPEVRANITKLSTIRIVPREKPNSTGQ